MSDTGAILAAIANLGGRFDALEARFGALETKVETLSADLTRFRVDIMDRLDRQQELLTRVKDDITVTDASDQKLRQTLDLMRADQTTLASRLSLVHRRLVELETRVDRQEENRS